VWKNDVEAYIYWVFGEIIVLYHKKFQNLNINKSYFCIFDGIRRNFNCRSIYKNLLYALNYIIYGVKAWINKIKNDVNWFYGMKKGEAKCKHFIVYYLAIKYTAEAYICVEIAYYVRN
jgi:hypothetical protein